MKISIAASDAYKIYAACLPFVSTEITRPYLQGVCLKYHEKGILLAFASDGYRLARCEVPYDAKKSSVLKKELSIILSPEAVKVFRKLKNLAEDAAALLTFGKKDVRIQCADIDEFHSRIVLSYPDAEKLWKNAARAATKKPTAHFNVRYLNDIAKAVKAVNGDRKNTDEMIGLVFARDDADTSPAIITTPDGAVHYLLMPMRWKL